MATSVDTPVVAQITLNVKGWRLVLHSNCTRNYAKCKRMAASVDTPIIAEKITLNVIEWQLVLTLKL
jgi:hypothetical protein